MLQTWKIPENQSQSRGPAGVLEYILLFPVGLKNNNIPLNLSVSGTTTVLVSNVTWKIPEKQSQNRCHHIC
jgi:hypothetical protein